MPAAWQTKWSGWLEPANMVVQIGRWMAWRDPNEGFLVATTLGTVGDIPSALYTLDTALQPGWPIITPASSDEEREAVKQRAWDLLQAQMEAADAGAIHRNS
jgi:hypothetical protein